MSVLTLCREHVFLPRTHESIWGVLVHEAAWFEVLVICLWILPFTAWSAHCDYILYYISFKLTVEVHMYVSVANIMCDSLVWLLIILLEPIWLLMIMCVSVNCTVCHTTSNEMLSSFYYSYNQLFVIYTCLFFQSVSSDGKHCYKPYIYYLVWSFPWSVICF